MGAGVVSGGGVGVGAGIIAGMSGTALGPAGEVGSDGATGAGAGCGTTFGVEGLNVGFGGGTGGVTGCARVWPAAKARIIAASDAAQNTPERCNLFATISGLLRRPSARPPAGQRGIA